MKIIIETILHSAQRYETVGDYWKDADGVDHIKVSEMGNDKYEFLVALHELIEMYLCEKRGIKEEDISDFDKKFEALREQEPEIIGDQEPGHMISAPYHKEHVTAESIERRMAVELDVDWENYDKTVQDL